MKDDEGFKHRFQHFLFLASVYVYVCVWQIFISCKINKHFVFFSQFFIFFNCGSKNRVLVGHNTLYRSTVSCGVKKKGKRPHFHPGYLVGAVVLLDPWLEADVQVQLVLLVVAGPGNLLEAIGFGVDELGVLGDRLVGVPDRQTERGSERDREKGREN